MSVVHTAELDQMQCAAPGCDHKDHSELHLHSRCHIESPQYAIMVDGKLGIGCAKCGLPIVVLEPKDKNLELKEACDCGNAAVDACYMVGQGKINLNCSTCEKVRQTIPLV